MMTLNFFYYSIETKELRNESNLIELFKLLRILNSLKSLNYLIQTHFKVITQSITNNVGLTGSTFFV